MSVMIGSPLFLSSAGYQISRSVRLRSSANAYLQRTNATTGTDPLKWTVSGWLKRGSSSVEAIILGSATGTAAFDFFGIWTGEVLTFRIRTSATVDVVRLESTPVYRDFSAWYHLVAIYDSANATSTERVKLYVNGVQVTAFTTATYPGLNQAPTGTFLTNMQIGRTNTNSTNQNYTESYLTEINFIDGQALDPSYFGETNTITGVWQPKKYTGTYGTNGWYLNFSDNSAATAAAIGKDYSGNGNNWTPNNISVTAGVTYDSMLDVPTQWADGGNGRGNYAVSNPINAASGLTVSDGNLKIAASAGGSKFVNSSISFPSSGAYYAEITFANASTNLIGQTIGIALGSRSLTAAYNATGSYHFYASNTGSLLSNGTETSGLSAISANEVFQVAVDVTNSKMWIGRSNVWYNSTGGTTGNPSTGANPTFTAAFVDFFVFAGFDTTSAVSANFNFGQRPFAYTPPSGFKALNTLNLPTPTILKGNQYFDATTYSGQNTSLSITNSGAMQPDLVWIKKRNGATDHNLTDAVRGTNKNLISNSTAAEDTTARLTSFDTGGFTLGGAFDNTNLSGSTYVGWQWKEGATQGFDIVTYTGDATTNRTVAHSLGVTPSMFIIKARSAATTAWIVHHKDLGNNGGSPAYLQYCELNTTAAKAASTSLLPVAGLSSTTFPTSGATNNTNVNGSGTTYIAYLFAAVAGFSAFGSYTGNGSADGPFVFLGFRPAFVMIKRTDAANDWVMMDELRLGYNQVNTYIEANTSDAEATDGGGAGSRSLDMLSNGFKLRQTADAVNASGGTHIFAAFAENPFKNALAR